MERTLRVFFVAVVMMAGCQFPAPPDVQPTDGPIDAPEIDRPPTPARLEAIQDLHDFGGVVIGGTSATFGVMVQNTGELAAGPIALSLTGGGLAEFEIVPTGDTSDCASQALAGGATCRAQVRFKPTVDQAAAASFVIAADPGGSIAVPVTGDALTAARLTSLVSTESFGGVVLGASSTLHRITIQNDGEQSTGLLGVTKAGPNQAEFAIVAVAGSDCQGATLAQQGTCQIDVRFSPAMAGTQRTATITVAGTPGGSYPITVTGDGLSPGDLTIEQPTGGATLDFGARDLGTGATSATQTIRVRNTGGVATGALVVTITGGAAASYALPLDGCSGNPLGANATCDIAVRFNPAAIGAQPATIQIRDNASGGTQAVNATGVGTGNIALTKVGTGTVTSAPAGLSCNGACPSQTGSFSTTPVTLTATPDAGWTFDSWGGACASAGTTNVCSVAITQALTSVSATFRQLFTLTLATTGAGVVTSNPFGITCGTGGTDCSEPYLIGTNVQLTADPDPGYEVASWTGSGVSCGPAQRTCSVSMTQARTVAIEFRPLRTLTVSTVGTGVGTISGGGINCVSPGTGTCTAQVIDGTLVTLTRTNSAAAAGSQNVFGGWGGDCNAFGVAAACTLTVDGAKNVAATFTLQHRLSLTINSVSGAMGSLLANPGNFLCNANTCEQYFNAGANLTITASPATGIDVLQSVTGACTMSPCSIANLDGPKTVTATFLPSPGDLQVVLPASGSLDFGSLAIGAGATSATQTIRIRNNGGSATGSLQVTITGAGASSYSTPGDACGGATLAAGATCDIAARFNPTAVGTLGAVVTVRDPLTGATRGVNVGGVGTSTVTVTKTGNGTITSTPAGIACGAGCVGVSTVFASTPVTLTATPDAGWAFDSWSGACAPAGTATTCSVNLTSATTNVGALFRPLYTLTVTPTGMGTITSAPAGIACGGDCTEAYVTGTSVTLTAEPAPGWEVASWAGTGTSCGAAQHTCTTSMTLARTVAVEFRPLYTVAVAISGSGAGVIAGGGINCMNNSGVCTAQIVSGTSLTLTQTPATVGGGTQVVFRTWGGDCASAGSATSCTIVVTSSRSVSGTFVRQHRLMLTVGSSGGAAGTLSANPGGFTCTIDTCERYYDVGTALTVTATPATALDVLQGVTGDCGTSPCAVAMDAPYAIAATFLPAPGNLEVVLPVGGGILEFGARQVGTGGASPTQTIRIRNNGGTATGVLDTTVTGTGSSAYVAVSDACDNLILGVGLTCDISVRFNPTAVGDLQAVVTVRDTVNGNARGVTVSGTGTGIVSVTKTGNGSVASTPAGVACGTTCSASFSSPPVTFIATADPGWVFDSWGGACTMAGSATTCSLSLAGASTSISATFRPLYTLAVTPSGLGGATSAPAGINCGADCSEAYLTGTSVTLTAEPAPGYEVFAWTGTGVACGVRQRTCTVSMTQDRAVGIEFRLLRTLAVSVNGSGVALVTGPDISCFSGSTCTAQAFDGTPVTLSTAIGDPSTNTRHVFNGWGGDCAAAGTALTCTVTMNASKNVVATATRQNLLTLAIQPIGGAMGSLSVAPGGFTCTAGSCQQFYDAGSALTITATPATPVDLLQGVSGACSVSPCALTLTSPEIVTATFQPTPGDLALLAPVSGSLAFGAVSFGGTSASDQVITIRNSGGSATGALATSMTGAGASSFTLVTDACNGVTLAANATCSVAVRFAPQAVGALAAIVSVRDTVSSTVRTVAVGGTGQGNVTLNKVGAGTVASTPAGLSCNAACGTVTTTFSTSPITLTATADPGWVLSTWAGACAAAGSAATCSLPLNAASTTVSATFVRIYTLNVATTGSGSVTSAPTGISCGADCTETYTTGTSVTLTAEPPAGWEVYAWTGTGTVCSVGQRSCAFTMTLDRNVSVEFRRRYTLAVNTGGAGFGTVVGTGGINCATGGGGFCSATLFDGALVTLSQTASAGPTGSQYVFTGWSGACTGTAGCSFTIGGDSSVTASYKVQHRLSFTIDSVGMAQGSLTAAPGGFACTSNTCVNFYDAATALTVAAAATRAGIDVLQAVTGDCSATPCSLTMNGPRNVTATVSPSAGNLVIDVGASISFGSVAIGTGGSSTPSPVTVRNSGGSATGTLSTVLGGAGAASYSMVSNGCTGTLAAGASCTIQVRFNPSAAGSQGGTVTVTDTGGSASVTANLTGTGTGSVMVTKTGSGTVNSAPVGISCGASCTSTFSSTPVVLTATPDAGYVFSSWGGACAGTSSTCSLPITAASQTASATFTQVWTLSVAVNGSGVVTAAPAGITCGNTNNDCTETYNTGTNVTLTVAPDAGYDVGVWTGTVTSCPAMQRTCVVPMTAARSVSVDLRPIPTVPKLARPLNGAYVGSAIAAGTRRPKFVWRASTVAGGGAITYDLQYSSDSTFASGVTTVSALALTEHQPTGDLTVNTSTAPKGTRYYWRVRACSQLVCSTYPTRYMVNVGRSDHDFNGDGYADLVAGRQGKLSVFFGPTLPTATSVNLAGPLTMTVGDFNGDGFADIAQLQPSATSVKVFYGSAVFNSVSDFEVFAFQLSDGIGSSITFADFNGDGFDDFAVGAPSYDVGPNVDVGRVDVFFGSAVPDTTSDVTYFGVQGDPLGYNLGGSDVNGDGYADLFLGHGSVLGTTVEMHSGSVSGPSVAAGQLLTNDAYVDTAGDLNADGYEDVISAVWTCPGFNWCPGVRLGAASGAGALISIPNPGSINDSFGYVLVGVGDVDRDGFDDIEVTAPGASVVRIYRGGASFDTSPDATYTGTGYSGNGACGGADVNGDGIAEFADGAVSEAVNGRVHVFFGQAGIVDVTPDILVTGTVSQENFGISCSL